MASRDRLGAYRAQQNYGDGGRGYAESEQPQSYAAPQGGYDPRRANPYAQQDDRGGSYEMDRVPQRGTPGGQNTPRGPAAGGDDLSAFYAEISSLQDQIRSFNESVAAIGDLQSRSLNNMDDAAGRRNAAELERLVDTTSSLSGELKRRIKDLERTGGGGRDGQVRKQQTAFVKSKFVEAIQNYQQVEQQYRQKYKQRIERQIKIVKPDATADEVQAVVNDEGGGQIFSQALLNSNRYGESRAAYREVQERHADIKKIEKTLTELAQLFQDMSVLVEQQDEQINVIQSNAVNIDTDIETGYKHTEKAVDSARAARKKRWICFWISIVIIIVVIIIILVVLHPWTVASSNKSS